jgi:alpha-beta hydrolase superfamily lysophospholipase
LVKPFYGNKTPFDWISSVDEEVAKYAEDPLCGYAYNARFYAEFFKAIVDVNKEKTILATPNIPLLFISGDEDPVGEFTKGVDELVQLYQGHAFEDMTRIYMPNARHEVLNEHNKEETYQKILAWLNQ